MAGKGAVLMALATGESLPLRQGHATRAETAELLEIAACFKTTSLNDDDRARIARAQQPGGISRPQRGTSLSNIYRIDIA